MENEVRPVSITFENIKGLPGGELRFRKMPPGEGQLIVIKGTNGVGKSTVLTAVDAILKGGHNSQWIRDGCEKATGQMLLSNGDDIKRVITRKGYSLKVMTPSSDKPMPSPESYMKRLASGFGFNPLKFLCAPGEAADSKKRKERLDYFMEVMPLSFSEAEILKAASEGLRSLTPAANIQGGLDISGVNRLLSDLKEKRAAVGSRRDERSSSVETFRKTLAAADQGDAPRDWKTELAGIEARKAGIETERDGEVKLIEDQIRGVRTEHEDLIRAAEDSARNRFTRLLEIARAGETKIGMQALTDDLVSVGKLFSALNIANYDAQEAIDNCRKVAAESIETLAADIATAKAGAEEQVRSGAIREQMERLRKEAAVLSKEWDAVAQSIKELEALRLTKLKELPVNGLDIREDGDIYMHGRQFDSWNTGQQFMYAMEIGAVGAGELGTLIADDTVHLGDELWKEFGEAVVASGLTVIASRLTSDPKLTSEPADALLVAA